MKLSVTKVTATVVGLSLVVVGWFAVDHLTRERDVINERRKQEMIYLVDAYRDIAAAACREELSRKEQRRFEDAYIVIQLLGSPGQIEILRMIRTQDSQSEWMPVLRALRDDIRKELDMPSVEEEGFQIWRWEPADDVCQPQQASNSGG